MSDNPEALHNELAALHHSLDTNRADGSWLTPGFDVHSIKRILRGAMSALAQQAATPAPAEPVAEHGELDPARAIATARAALGYSAAFDGKGIDWQSDDPWPHRIELAQALDWVTDLGAMVLNLADRVAAPPATPAAQPPTGRPIAWTITAPDGRQWYGERLTDAALAARRDTATPAAQLAEGVVQRLMGLAMDLAHVYTFVGDNTMPRAKTALESALRAALAQAVPAGFRLVPEKPTEAMVEAGASQSSLMDYKRGSRAMWAAMLAAAPSAPSAAQEKPE